MRRTWRADCPRKSRRFCFPRAPTSKTKSARHCQPALFTQRRFVLKSVSVRGCCSRQRFESHALDAWAMLAWARPSEFLSPIVQTIRRVYFHLVVREVGTKLFNARVAQNSGKCLSKATLIFWRRTRRCGRSRLVATARGLISTWSS